MIIDRLLRVFEVDPVQWRALLRASYYALTRNPASVRGIGSAAANRAKGIVVILIFYLMLGVVFAFISWKGEDPAIAASILLIPTSFFIASLILLEFGATVISPEDFSVLSVHPVTSRTYFAARISLIIALTLLLAGVLNIPAAIAIAVVRSIPEAAVWLFAAACNAIATGMGMILLYTAALRVIPYRRLMTIMGYFQMTISFVVYGGFGLIMSRMNGMIGGLNVALPWWWRFFPPVWFAALMSLAAGLWSLENILLACCGFILLGVLIPAAASKVSLSYAESISRASTAESARRPGVRFPGITSLLKRSEDRAIASLIARQFRYDVKFKMTILGIIPLTALYVYQGIQGGGRFYDPFQPGLDLRGMAGSSLLYVAIILFPGILKDEIGRSDNFQAAWVFFATPADRVALVLAVKRVLTVYFLVPYLFLLGFVFYYFFRNPLHVVMHVVVMLLASQFLLQMTFFISPRLPFSMPRGMGERFGLTALVMLLGPVILLLMLVIFSRYFYVNLVSYAVGTASLAILVAIAERLLRIRVAKRVSGLEFTG